MLFILGFFAFERSSYFTSLQVFSQTNMGLNDLTIIQKGKTFLYTKEKKEKQKICNLVYASFTALY